MAKLTPSKGGTARIRFIMLDAEIPEGDLSQITSAIQNALKPAATIIHQRVLPNQVSAPLPNGQQQAGAEGEDQPIDVEENSQQDEIESRRARESRVRKPTSMKVIDLDLISGTSFEAFVSHHVPKNDTERNLVALA